MLVRGREEGAKKREFVARFGEHVIFALDVVQPSADSKEALVCCKKLLGFGAIDKADGVQKLYAVRFTL